MKLFNKDPDAVLDYKYDWSSWLVSGDAISTATVTSETGLTVDSYANDDTSVTAWLSGGTTGVTYLVTCSITTEEGRTENNSIRIHLEER